eukprot:2482704-Pleurochrysis_carterae.AAC.1
MSISPWSITGSNRLQGGVGNSLIDNNASSASERDETASCDSDMALHAAYDFAAHFEPDTMSTSTLAGFAQPQCIPPGPSRRSP